MEHFNAPHNFGKLLEENASSKVVSSVTGDMVLLSLLIVADHIQEIRGTVFGCAASIAAVSVLTTLVVGKSLHEAEEFETGMLVEGMGGLPEAKLDCPALAVEALHQAIENYGVKNG